MLKYSETAMLIKRKENNSTTIMRTCMKTHPLHKYCTHLNSLDMTLTKMYGNYSHSMNISNHTHMLYVWCERKKNPPVLVGLRSKD